VIEGRGSTRVRKGTFLSPPSNVTQKNNIKGPTFSRKKYQKQKNMIAIKTLKQNLDSIEVTGPRFTAKSEFSQCRVTADGKALKLKLNGTLFMLPTKNEHDDYGTSFKMGVECDGGDMTIFENIMEKMYDELDDDQYDPKQPHDDGSIFFKLPTNKALSEFTFESNVPIKPGKLHNDRLEQFMPVTLDLLVSGWYLRKNENGVKDENGKQVKKFGLTYKIRKITFGGEKARSKKRKTDEDEVSPSPE